MSLLDFLFPPRCLGCGALSTTLCPSCVNLFLPLSQAICPQCSHGSYQGYTHPHCRTPNGLDGLTSTFAYRGIVKKTIQKFKYQFISSLIPTLIELMVSQTDFTPLMKESWTIIPVPLHPRRLRWRGFNQAALLAEALAHYTHWAYDSQILKRIRHTPPQMSLDRAHRLTNLQNTFALSHPLSPKSHHLLLVDDVWTTGATLSECTHTLKKGGASKVWAFTLARVLSH